MAEAQASQATTQAATPLKPTLGERINPSSDYNKAKREASPEARYQARKYGERVNAREAERNMAWGMAFGAVNGIAENVRKERVHTKRFARAMARNQGSFYSNKFYEKAAQNGLLHWGKYKELRKQAAEDTALHNELKRLAGGSEESIRKMIESGASSEVKKLYQDLVVTRIRRSQTETEVERIQKQLDRTNRKLERGNLQDDKRRELQAKRAQLQTSLVSANSELTGINEKINGKDPNPGSNNGKTELQRIQEITKDNAAFEGMTPEEIRKAFDFIAEQMLKDKVDTGLGPADSPYNRAKFDAALEQYLIGGKSEAELKHLQQVSRLNFLNNSSYLYSLALVGAGALAVSTPVGWAAIGVGLGITAITSWHKLRVDRATRAIDAARGQVNIRAQKDTSQLQGVEKGMAVLSNAMNIDWEKLGFDKNLDISLRPGEFKQSVIDLWKNLHDRDVATAFGSRIALGLAGKAASFLLGSAEHFIANTSVGESIGQLKDNALAEVGQGVSHIPGVQGVENIPQGLGQDVHNLLQQIAGEKTGCFVAGTMILMADGTQKGIEAVTIGEKVYSYDEATQQIVVKAVEEIVTPIHGQMVMIAFASGIKNTNTFDHPYFIKDKGWASYNPEMTKKNYGLEVVSLTTGDIAHGYNEGKLDEVEITDIQVISGQTQTYNLSKIADTHTYFANGILVHNKTFDATVANTPKAPMGTGVPKPPELTGSHLNQAGEWQDQVNRDWTSSENPFGKVVSVAGDEFHAVANRLADLGDNIAGHPGQGSPRIFTETPQQVQEVNNLNHTVTFQNSEHFQFDSHTGKLDIVDQQGRILVAGVTPHYDGNHLSELTGNNGHFDYKFSPGETSWSTFAAEHSLSAGKFSSEIYSGLPDPAHSPYLSDSIISQNGHVGIQFNGTDNLPLGSNAIHMQNNGHDIFILLNQHTHSVNIVPGDTTDNVQIITNNGIQTISSDQAARLLGISSQSIHNWGGVGTLSSDTSWAGQHVFANDIQLVHMQQGANGQWTSQVFATAQGHGVTDTSTVMGGETNYTILHGALPAPLTEGAPGIGSSPFEFLSEHPGLALAAGVGFLGHIPLNRSFGLFNRKGNVGTGVMHLGFVTAAELGLAISPLGPGIAIAAGIGYLSPYAIRIAFRGLQGLGRGVAEVVTGGRAGGSPSGRSAPASSAASGRQSRRQRRRAARQAASARQGTQATATPSPQGSLPPSATPLAANATAALARAKSSNANKGRIPGSRRNRVANQDRKEAVQALNDNRTTEDEGTSRMSENQLQALMNAQPIPRGASDTDYDYAQKITNAIQNQRGARGLDLRGPTNAKAAAQMMDVGSADAATIVPHIQRIAIAQQHEPARFGQSRAVRAMRDEFNERVDNTSTNPQVIRDQVRAMQQVFGRGQGADPINKAFENEPHPTRAIVGAMVGTGTPENRVEAGLKAAGLIPQPRRIGNGTVLPQEATPQEVAAAVAAIKQAGILGNDQQADTAIRAAVGRVFDKHNRDAYLDAVNQALAAPPQPNPNTQPTPDTPLSDVERRKLLTNMQSTAVQLAGAPDSDEALQKSVLNYSEFARDIEAAKTTDNRTVVNETLGQYGFNLPTNQTIDSINPKELYANLLATNAALEIFSNEVRASLHAKYPWTSQLSEETIAELYGIAEVFASAPADQKAAAQQHLENKLTGIKAQLGTNVPADYPNAETFATVIRGITASVKTSVESKQANLKRAILDRLNAQAPVQENTRATQISVDLEALKLGDGTDLAKILTTTELISQRDVLASADKALERLSGKAIETLQYPDVPVFFIGDVHARPDYILTALTQPSGINAADGTQMSVLQAVKVGKMQLVFGGDLLHSEHGIMATNSVDTLTSVTTNTTGSVKSKPNGIAGHTLYSLVKWIDIRRQMGEDDGAIRQNLEGWYDSGTGVSYRENAINEAFRLSRDEAYRGELARHNLPDNASDDQVREFFQKVELRHTLSVMQAVWELKANYPQYVNVLLGTHDQFTYPIAKAGVDQPQVLNQISNQFGYSTFVEKLKTWASKVPIVLKGTNVIYTHTTPGTMRDEGTPTQATIPTPTVQDVEAREKEALKRLTYDRTNPVGGADKGEPNIAFARQLLGNPTDDILWINGHDDQGSQGVGEYVYGTTPGDKVKRIIVDSDTVFAYAKIDPSNQNSVTPVIVQKMQGENLVSAIRSGNISRPNAPISPVPPPSRPVPRTQPPPPSVPDAGSLGRYVGIPELDQQIMDAWQRAESAAQRPRIAQVGALRPNYQKVVDRFNQVYGEEVPRITVAQLEALAKIRENITVVAGFDDFTKAQTIEQRIHADQQTRNPSLKDFDLRIPEYAALAVRVVGGGNVARRVPEIARNVQRIAIARKIDPRDQDGFEKVFTEFNKIDNFDNLTRSDLRDQARAMKAGAAVPSIGFIRAVYSSEDPVTRAVIGEGISSEPVDKRFADALRFADLAEPNGDVPPNVHAEDVAKALFAIAHTFHPDAEVRNIFEYGLEAYSNSNNNFKNEVRHFLNPSTSSQPISVATPASVPAQPASIPVPAVTPAPTPPLVPAAPAPTPAPSQTSGPSGGTSPETEARISSGISTPEELRESMRRFIESAPDGTVEDTYTLRGVELTSLLRARLDQEGHGEPSGFVTKDGRIFIQGEGNSAVFGSISDSYLNEVNEHLSRNEPTNQPVSPAEQIGEDIVKLARDNTPQDWFVAHFSSTDAGLSITLEKSRNDPPGSQSQPSTPPDASGREGARVSKIREAARELQDRQERQQHMRENAVALARIVNRNASPDVIEPALQAAIIGYSQFEQDMKQAEGKGKQGLVAMLTQYDFPQEFSEEHTADGINHLYALLIGRLGALGLVHEGESVSNPNALVTSIAEKIFEKINSEMLQRAPQQPLQPSQPAAVASSSGAIPSDLREAVVASTPDSGSASRSVSAALGGERFQDEIDTVVRIPVVPSPESSATPAAIDLRDIDRIPAIQAAIDTYASGGELSPNVVDEGYKEFRRQYEALKNGGSDEQKLRFKRYYAEENADNFADMESNLPGMYAGFINGKVIKQWNPNIFAPALTSEQEARARNLVAQVEERAHRFDASNQPTNSVPSVIAVSSSGTPIDASRVQPVSMQAGSGSTEESAVVTVPTGESESKPINPQKEKQARQNLADLGLTPDIVEAALQRKYGMHGKQFRSADEILQWVRRFVENSERIAYKRLYTQDIPVEERADAFAADLDKWVRKLDRVDAQDAATIPFQLSPNERVPSEDRAKEYLEGLGLDSHAIEAVMAQEHGSYKFPTIAALRGFVERGLDTTERGILQGRLIDKDPTGQAQVFNEEIDRRIGDIPADIMQDLLHANLTITYIRQLYRTHLLNQTVVRRVLLPYFADAQQHTSPLKVLRPMTSSIQGEEAIVEARNREKIDFGDAVEEYLGRYSMDLSAREREAYEALQLTFPDDPTLRDAFTQRTQTLLDNVGQLAYEEMGGDTSVHNEPQRRSFRDRLKGSIYGNYLKQKKHEQVLLEHAAKGRNDQYRDMVRLIPMQVLAPSPELFMAYLRERYNLQVNRVDDVTRAAIEGLRQEILNGERQGDPGTILMKEQLLEGTLLELSKKQTAPEIVSVAPGTPTTAA